jgi:hypothetical protein
MQSKWIGTLLNIVRNTALKALGLALVALACASVAMADFPNPAAVPEIDPNSAASALTILCGGVLCLTARPRRNKAE